MIERPWQASAATLAHNDAQIAERDKRIAELEADRRVLQSTGEHPAPCAHHCEANAFRIELRNKEAALAYEQRHAAESETALAAEHAALLEANARIAELVSAAQTDAIQIGLLEGYREQLRKEVAERDQDIAAANAHIAELEKQATIDKTLLALADARINRELLGKLRERDARIAELEACVRERDEHLGLLQEELDTWIHTNTIDVLQRRIAELEAEAGVDRALLALADARLNREVLKTKGGA